MYIVKNAVGIFFILNLGGSRNSTKQIEGHRSNIDRKSMAATLRLFEPRWDDSNSNQF